MFAIIATKPLTDGTKGFRFNILGTKGVLRKRKALSRGWAIVQGKSTKAYHMGKLSVYVESKPNMHSTRVFRHFAG
jgi:hypothetical protein